MIRRILDSIEYINRQILHVEDQMDLYFTRMKQDVDLLMTIPGVSKQIATGMLSEVGDDMEHFPTQKHLASWAGICPRNNENAGKKKSSKITDGNRYLKTTLVEAAWKHPHQGATHFR